MVQGPSNFHVITFSVFSVYSRFYYILSKNFCAERDLRQHVAFKKARDIRKGYCNNNHMKISHPCYLVHCEKAVELHLCSTNNISFLLLFFSK